LQLEDNEDNIKEEGIFCYVIHEQLRHDVFFN